MTNQMTQTDLDHFLQAPRHAIVGTNPVDGAPQLTPVWYLYRDKLFYISINAGIAKHRNLQRDSRISLCIDGCHPDARAVMIYGTAELIEKGEPLEEEIRWRIIRHYHDTEEAARRYADQAQAWETILIVVTPQKIISQDFN